MRDVSDEPVVIFQRISSHPIVCRSLIMDKYRVKPGSKVDLRKFDPKDMSELPEGKEEGKTVLDDLNDELEELQELMYAERRRKVLIVLQGMDTSGKDGTIRHVFDRVNPQGVSVANFKVPTELELAHDYLWRVHQKAPGKGEIVIFNRSHYEDVLVVRVHNLVPEKVWSKRYAHINDFERLLAEEGTTILKFFLHISLEEQKERLQARLDDPHKQWKFRMGDLEERKRWKEYTRAYEDAISETSTEWAPWYIIPADRKWYRNLVIGSIVVTALKEFEMQYPEPEENLDGIVIE
jgi:PPK2 family polyphosphate:nucleotide phosphotransferase